VTVTMFLFPLIMGINGVTFWLNAKTSRIQGRHWRILFGIALGCWAVAVLGAVGDLIAFLTGGLR